MITRRDLLLAIKSFPSWASIEEIISALPEAQDSDQTVVEMLDRMVRDRILTTDVRFSVRRYTLRDRTQKPKTPLEMIYPGLAAIEKSGMATGFLLGTALTISYSKDFRAKEDRIYQLLDRWVNRASKGLELPIPLSIMNELNTMQNRTSHFGIHAAILRIRDIYEGRGPAPAPSLIRYNAAEFSSAVIDAIRNQDANRIPVWATAHVPDKEHVLALLTALHGSLEFSKNFLLRCAVQISRTELRLSQRETASNLRIRTSSVRTILDDLDSGGSLASYGEMRSHQLKVIAALRPLPYSEQAIEVVCTLRAMHATQGNVTQSAKYIGIPRATLDRWLLAYGLERLKGGDFGFCPL